jgi:hypothetical protein
MGHLTQSKCFTTIANTLLRHILSQTQPKSPFLRRNQTCSAGFAFLRGTRGLRARASVPRAALFLAPCVALLQAAKSLRLPRLVAEKFTYAPRTMTRRLVYAASLVAFLAGLFRPGPPSADIPDATQSDRLHPREHSDPSVDKLGHSDRTLPPPEPSSAPHD